MKFEKKDNVFRFYENSTQVGVANCQPIKGKNEFFIMGVRAFEKGKGYGTEIFRQLLNYARENHFTTVAYVALNPISEHIGKTLGFSIDGYDGSNPIMRCKLGYSLEYQKKLSPGQVQTEFKTTKPYKREKKPEKPKEAKPSELNHYGLETSDRPHLEKWVIEKKLSELKKQKAQLMER